MTDLIRAGAFHGYAHGIMNFDPVVITGDGDVANSERQILDSHSISDLWEKICG